MSRWFRHYAGLCRDDKLVRVADRSGVALERVYFVWLAILESAAEIDSDGTYDVFGPEIAYRLNADGREIEDVIYELSAEGMVSSGYVKNFDEFSRWSGRMPWAEWAVVRLGIFQRDDFKCRYCGVHGVPLECDHVHPVSRGGTDDKSNLVTACIACNRKKADKTLDEIGWTL